MQNPQRSVQLAPQGDSVVLVTALGALQNQLFVAAEMNIDDAISGNPGAYTELQRRSMIAAEALRLTSGMDLSAIITRGNIIHQIEVEGLAGVHPNGYANLTALAAENGVSTGEFSDIRAMTDTIFPYIMNVLGRNLMEVWDEVGKSAFREMVPALRSLITGVRADHASVVGAVAAMISSAEAQLIAENFEQPLQAEDVRRQAVETLLHAGATLPSRELRRRVRPSRVPPIEMATLQVANGEFYAVMHLATNEQKDLALRVMNSHVNNQMMNGTGRDAADHRRILGSFFGTSDDR